MKQFNVINYSINKTKFESYDVIPYLVNTYKNVIKKHQEYPDVDYWKVPKTFEEFKEFVKKESLHQFWARCEYEIILSPWPYTLSPSERAKGENDVEAWKEHWKKHLKECEKIDIHDQIMMNIDVITALVMDSVINE